MGTNRHVFAADRSSTPLSLSFRTESPLILRLPIRHIQAGVSERRYRLLLLPLGHSKCDSQCLFPSLAAMSSSAADSTTFSHVGDESLPPATHDDVEDDVDSLPSTETDDTLDEQGESDAEREWRESLQQLELILTMVLVPYIGKYFGRKAAYWG